MFTSLVYNIKNKAVRLTKIKKKESQTGGRRRERGKEKEKERKEERIERTERKKSAKMRW